MSHLAKVKMSYSGLQCPTVMGGHDGRKGWDYHVSKGTEPTIRYRLTIDKAITREQAAAIPGLTNQRVRSIAGHFYFGLT